MTRPHRAMLAVGVTICALAATARGEAPPVDHAKAKEMLDRVHRMCDALAHLDTDDKFLKAIDAIRPAPDGSKGLVFDFKDEPRLMAVLSRYDPLSEFPRYGHLLRARRSELLKAAITAAADSDAPSTPTALQLMTALGRTAAYVDPDEPHLQVRGINFSWAVKGPGSSRCVVRANAVREGFPAEGITGFTFVILPIAEEDVLGADASQTRFDPSIKWPAARHDDDDIEPPPEPPSEYPANTLRWSGAQLLIEGCRRLAKPLDTDAMAGALGAAEVLENDELGPSIDEFDLAGDPWFRHGNVLKGTAPNGNTAGAVQLTTAKESHERASNLKLDTLVDALHLKPLVNRKVHDLTYMKLAVASEDSKFESFTMVDGMTPEEAAKAQERDRQARLHARRLRKTRRLNFNPEWQWPVHQVLFDLAVPDGPTCRLDVRALVDERSKVSRVTSLIILYPAPPVPAAAE